MTPYRERPIVKAITPTALKRILKALPVKTAHIDFYPRTPYFSNSDFVNWCWMTQNFLPVNVNRILVLARTYEYPQLVAKAILASSAPTPSCTTTWTTSSCRNPKPC
ncbi:MAG: hypothetical protein J5917_01490 [Bacteroidales bacterium]|nr:hypothetical protein [Bacteroidales bacterium]